MGTFGGYRDIIRNNLLTLRNGDKLIRSDYVVKYDKNIYSIFNKDIKPHLIKKSFKINDIIDVIEKI